MKILGELANIIAWVVIIAMFSLFALLFWEDRQDVMTWIDIKQGTEIGRTDDSLVLHLAGYKRPAMDHCKKIPFSDVAYVAINDYKREAAFRYVDDDTPLSTFDGGKLDLGLAEFDALNAGSADLAGLSFSHMCRGEVKESPIYWIRVAK